MRSTANSASIVSASTTNTTSAITATNGKAIRPAITMSALLMGVQAKWN